MQAKYKKTLDKSSVMVYNIYTKGLPMTVLPCLRLKITVKVGSCGGYLFLLSSSEFLDKYVSNAMIKMQNCNNSAQVTAICNTSLRKQRKER